MEGFKSFMDILSMLGGMLIGIMLVLVPVLSLLRYVRCRGGKGRRVQETCTEEDGKKVIFLLIPVFSACFSYGIYVMAGSINYYVDAGKAPVLSAVTADIMSAAIYIFVLVCALAMLIAAVCRGIRRRNSKDNHYNT